MNNQLLQLLAARVEAGKPLRVGLIGAGRFGSMFLSQARRVPGLHVLGVADVSVEQARTALRRIEWPEEPFAAASFADALRTGATYLTDDGQTRSQRQDVQLLPRRHQVVHRDGGCGQCDRPEIPAGRPELSALWGGRHCPRGARGPMAGR